MELRTAGASERRERHHTAPTEGERESEVAEEERRRDLAQGHSDWMWDE